MTDATSEDHAGLAGLSYAEATAELDAIIAEFDQGQVDVDRLAERFQRATELVEELDRRIRVNRRQVERLSPRLDAVARGTGGSGALEDVHGPGDHQGDGGQ
jgi:exodeoxyribonuclease VII small subunit